MMVWMVVDSARALFFYTFAQVQSQRNPRRGMQCKIGETVRNERTDRRADKDHMGGGSFSRTNDN